MCLQVTMMWICVAMLHSCLPSQWGEVATETKVDGFQHLVVLGEVQEILWLHVAVHNAVQVTMRKHLQYKHANI